MKRYCALILAVLLCLCFSVPAMAQTEVRLLVDQGNLLNSYEETTVLSALTEVRRKHGLDVVIVTANTLGGKSPMTYADDYYDDHGYGPDGILLLVSMEDRDWWISTAGYGITAFTDAGIDYMAGEFVPALSDGDYADAFKTFAQCCDAFLTQAKSGDPYDTHNLPGEPFALVRNLLICLVIGFLIALIVTGLMKSQLNTVHKQAGASQYVKPGSMNVTHRQDLFLYSQVHRREKPKDNGGSGTHRSGSGRSHGGGGGKF